MDSRFAAPVLNQTPDYEVWFHPTAEINDVRTGLATDGVDWSQYVSTFSHALDQTSVTLAWNHTFDTYSDEPVYGSVLEIKSQGLPYWIGVVNSVTEKNFEFGRKTMTVVARSRETEDIWKLSKMVTNLYPQATNLGQIIQDVATFVGLFPEEIVVPTTSITTAHSNTQLANISAWEMITALFMPLGLTPAINGLGQLAGYSRNLQNRKPDIVLTEKNVIRVNETRQRPPTTRYTLNWLDPNLTKVSQQGRMLARATMTSGFFLPFLYHDVYFSDDHTQRAENTYLAVKQSANALWIPVCLEQYEQNYENQGRIKIISLGYTQGLLALALAVKIASAYPDFATIPGGPTIPTGKIAQGFAEIALYFVMMSIGTGQYEVWGTPYDWKHAKNTTEAYDTSAVQWLDNPQTVECDLIMNEAHADAIVTQELIYLSRAANQTTITLIDDNRIERGDILQFPDGSLFYVTAFNRRVTRAQPVEFAVQGFLI